jgi:hypothetical protein
MPLLHNTMHHLAAMVSCELSASIGAPTGSSLIGSRRSPVNSESGPSRGPFGVVLLPPE